MKFTLLIGLALTISCLDMTGFDLAFSFAGVGSPISYEECMANPTFRIDAVKITPDDISAGDDVSIKAKGTALEEMTLKDLELVVKISGIDLITKTEDLGSIALAEGDTHVLSYAVTIPSFVPTGNYEVYIHIRNPNKADVNCIKASFTL